LTSFLRTNWIESPWHRRFFYALILLIPFGGKIRFFETGSTLYGAFAEYTIWELYVTDIVIGTVLVSWFIEIINNKLSKKKATVAALGKKIPLSVFAPFFILLFLSILSILWSVSPQTALYRSLKLAQWGMIMAYVSQQTWLKREFAVMALMMLLGGVIQSFFTFWQFFLQIPLSYHIPFVGETLAHLIGEQPLSIWDDGISYVWLLGQKIIRPYGTTPHPNMLAAYLLISLIATLGLFVARKKQPIRFKKLLIVSAILISIAIVLTLSRQIWMVILILAPIIWVVIAPEQKHLFKQKVIGKKSGIILITILALPLLLLTSGRILALFSNNSFSLSSRAYLNLYALEMIADHPFGVGMGNFVYLIRVYDISGMFNSIIQPVHNVFLLIASEIGTIASVVFTYFLYSVSKSLVEKRSKSTASNYQKTIRNSLFLILSTFLIIMFLDHYLWTLQTGQLLLWISMGLILSKNQSISA